MLVETLYFISAVLQLAAMFFALRMAREVDDRGPWLSLFAALFVMFAFRVLALFTTAPFRDQFSPYVGIIISAFLLVALFSIRRVTMAERESKRLAEVRTQERDESEGRYRSLIELSPEVIFVNSAGKIAYANPAALRFFAAADPARLLGRSPLDFVDPATRPLVEARLAQLSRVGEVVPPVRETWVRLDGSHVPVEAVAAVVPWHGHEAILVVLRDISDSVRAEEEKTQLLASERVARSTAEHTSRMKDEFLATLSHELRTPLNAILGWSQVLRNGHRSAGDLTEGLAAIERNARVQTKLIEDLLDMSRIISGKIRLDIQNILPITFIEEAIATVRLSAQAKGVRLEPVLDSLAGPVNGDPSRMQQVVWNLLSNAVRFTPKGGKIQIILRRVNSHIEIAIADTGQGIRPEFLTAVFDRFRQADASTTRRHGGLGLGLSIAKQLVELHGGSIAAQSAGEGHGATFVVQLPLRAVHPQIPVVEEVHPRDSTTVVSAPQLDSSTVDLSGLKILVVDDEADACSLIQRVLHDFHANVFTASSATEAMASLELNEPDILISDIGMPEIDGYELLRRVRAMKSAKSSRIPAIALTAFARSEDRTRALMAGYSVHVSKPVEPQELVATVASLAGRTGVAVS